MEYKVITKGSPLEVWAAGFYGEHGKAKAEKRIAEGYWHRFMYEKDKHKELEVVPEGRAV
jgi:hypothetical protein